MTCIACSQIIEAETVKISGVDSAQVNFATETAEFSVNDAFDFEMLQGLLRKLGYRAVDLQKKINLEEDRFFNKDWAF